MGLARESIYDLSGLISFGRAALLRSYYDLLTISLITLLFAAALVTARRRTTACRAVVSAFTAVAVICCLLSVVNVKAVQMLGGPITYEWLYYGDFLSTVAPQNTVREAMTPKFTVVFLLAPIALLAGARLSVWILSRPHAGPTVPALAIGCLAFVYFSVTSAHLQDAGLSRGELANPLVEFARTAATDDGETLFTLPTSADTSDYAAAAEPLPPSPVPRREGGGIVRNVLLVVMESVGAKPVYSRVGAHPATPNLDRLAPISMRFDSLYAHIPTSPKSLFSLLTSTYPLVSYKSETKEYARARFASLSAELRSRGYRTALFMSGDLRFQTADKFLEGRGFDTLMDLHTIPCQSPLFIGSTPKWEAVDIVHDSCAAEAVVDWIGRDREQPFFAVFWTGMTHSPYFSDAEKIDFRVGNGPLNEYLNALRASDRAIGRVVGHLAEVGLLDSTLIVVVGDHGEAFGEHRHWGHGRTIFEEEVRVPLLLINSSLFAGERNPVIGGAVDVGPTILDVLGLPSAAGWQGRSLFARDRPERVYLASPYRDFLVGYREGRLKYVFNATRNKLGVYDVVADPHERTDLAPQMPDVAATVQERLATWVQHQERLFLNLSEPVRQVRRSDQH